MSWRVSNCVVLPIIIISQISNYLCTSPIGSYHNVSLNHLLQPDICIWLHSSASFPRQLLANLTVEPNLKYKKLNLHFNFEACDTNISQQQFMGLIHELDATYSACVNCLLITLEFNYKMQPYLTNWSQQVLPSTKTDFRAHIIANTSLYIRPILDGCAVQHSHILLPKSKSDFIRLAVPAAKCKLASARLNVTINDQPPYCQLAGTFPNGTVRLGADYSVDYDLLRALEARFHFVSNLIYANNIFGAVWDSQARRWIGTVGMVYNRTSTLGICALSRTLDRLELVDFTTFTSHDAVAFFTLKPKLKKRDWLIVAPFSGIIWLGILSSFALMTCVANWIIKHSTMSQANHSLFYIIFASYALFFGHSTQITKLSHASIRILLSTWILVALILIHTYGGTFYSLLTVPEREKPIDTLDDLIDFIHRRRPHLLTSALLKSTFINSTPDNPVYYQLGQYINKTNPPHLSKLTPMMEKLAETSPNFVEIASRMFFSSLINNYRLNMFHVGEESLNMATQAIALAKKSPLLVPFNLAIQQMHEMGLMFKFLQRTFARRIKFKNPSQKVINFIKIYSELFSQDPQQQHRERTLKLTELFSIFLLWLIGIGFSCAGFAMEMACLLIHSFMSFRA